MKIGRMTWVAMAIVLAMLMVVGCANLFEQPEARSVRERIAIEASEDSYIKYGSDLYFYSDNKSTQKLQIEGSTGNVDGEGTLDIAGASDLKGNLSDSGGAFTIADNVMVDGAADAIQLTVQGYTTQTTGLLVLETSGGTDKLTVSNDGNLAVAGTADIAGTLQYGANNLYVLGYGTTGYKVVMGTTNITGTATAAHGLTTVTWALCTLGKASHTDAGDAAWCTATVSANVVTLETWQDDAVAATEAAVPIHWLVIGLP